MSNLPDWFMQCMECKHAYENPDEAGEYLCKIGECAFEPHENTYKKHIKDSTELSGGTLW